MKDNHQMTKIT